ncbi:hypothetical protein Hanom_Chr00s000001g01594271 [Helianthus anomalus]
MLLKLALNGWQFPLQNHHDRSSHFHLSLSHSTHVYVATCISNLSLSGCVQGFKNGRKLIGGGKVYKHMAVFTRRGPITTFHPATNRPTIRHVVISLFILIFH